MTLDYLFDKNHFPSTSFMEVLKFFLSPEKLQFCNFVVCAYYRRYTTLATLQPCEFVSQLVSVRLRRLLSFFKFCIYVKLFCVYMILLIKIYTMQKE